MILTAVPGDSAQQAGLAGADLADDRQVHRRAPRWRRRRRARRTAYPSMRGVVEATAARHRRDDVLGARRARARPAAAAATGGSGSTPARMRSRCSSTEQGGWIGRPSGSESCREDGVGGDALRATVGRQLDVADHLDAARRRSSRRRRGATVGLLHRRARPRGSACRTRRPACRSRRRGRRTAASAGDLVEHEVLADVVDVGAQHQQVVGRLDRHEPVAADLDQPASPRRPRSPRPSRSRSGSPRAWTGRSGRRVLTLRISGSPRMPSRTSSASFIAAQVEPQVVGRAEPVPVEVGQRVLVLGQGLRGLAQHDPAVGLAAREVAALAVATAYAGPPRSRTAHRWWRTSRRPARPGRRRGCRSWRRRRRS